MRHTITDMLRKATLIRDKSVLLNVALLIICFSSCSSRSDQPSSQSESESQQVAEQSWYSLLTKCGDSYYARDNRGYTGAELIVYQFNDVSVEVKPRKLTEADRMNGVEWDGTAFLRCKTSRQHVASWSPWSNGSAFTGGAVILTKVRGRWLFGGRENSTPPLRKIDCSDVPR